MNCPKCGGQIEAGDAGTISSDYDEDHEPNSIAPSLSMEWFCEDCKIGGTVKYILDPESLTIDSESEDED